MYFEKRGFCKFDSDCSFLHRAPDPKNAEFSHDMLKLKEEFELVVTHLKEKGRQIEKLEKKVKDLEKLVEARKESPETIHCDSCEYSCKSSTVLKRHRSKKHKIHCTPENSKVWVENIAEFSTSSASPLSNPKTLTCPLCPETFSKDIEFLKHMDDIRCHVVDARGMCTVCADCNATIGEYPYCESTLKIGGFHMKTTPSEYEFNAPHHILRAFCKSCTISHQGENAFQNSIYD